jgi:dsRNA-specific ribonuclease
MKYLISTYLYGSDISNVLALGKSIRLFSSIPSMCIVTPSVGIKDRVLLLKSYTYVEISDSPLDMILSMDNYDRIMILNSNTLITSKIDILLSVSPSGSPRLSMCVITPSRLIAKIIKVGSDIDLVRSFFIDNGYKWKTIDSKYDNVPTDKARSLMYKGMYLNNNSVNIESYLYDLLGTILGDRGREAVDKELYTYLLVFTHESSNPVSNYDTLEAYGDGLLKGAYMWILDGTPGIISSDQITKITDYFGSKEILSDIAERLDMVKYIDSNDNIDVKIKSDIVEAMIGAIAFSWERLYGKGDEGVRLFVSHIYSPYTIDVENYKEAYTSPIQTVNIFLTSHRLNRDLLSHKITQDYNNIIYKLMYNGQIIGVGIVSKDGTDLRVLDKVVKDRAYSDAISKKSLEKFVTN